LSNSARTGRPAGMNCGNSPNRSPNS